jgi:Cu(I)/Ag(I) efflux system membrane protein CusA/SilA
VKRGTSMLGRVIRFCLEQKLVVVLTAAAIVAWGVAVAPFDWELGAYPRSPVAVDAIPDIGENQQIVFTDWPGRSPQDVQDQITYPLTVSLLGIPGVRTIRSFSMFGFSSIYVIFETDAEFYWSRSRVLEKLNSLPAETLPADVSPVLGPDATALGQVFWYTLEGRDENGRTTGGWDLHELRSIQDWIVRYALQSAGGVSEVASVGGFVREYQIDVDPDAMRAYGVTLEQVFKAVRSANTDVGARTIEVNKVEYVIRGLGFIESLEDIEETAIKAEDHVPVRIKDVAHVGLGPALRRGVLDKGGAEAVGGVVVARYQANPLETIRNVKAKIAEIAPGLPTKTLADGTTSRVTVVPFYDRTGLIFETLGTLNAAIYEEILVTLLVVVAMVMHFRSSLLIAGILPMAVLLCFIAMRYFGVDANIVALSGIAIAVGTIVDMGIVVCENILKELDAADPSEPRIDVVYRASTAVGSAVVTAVATTVIGFLPVFTLEAAEGKLFRPLAYTKTFALVAAVLVALTIIPVLAQVLFTFRVDSDRRRNVLSGILLLLAAYVGVRWSIGLAAVVAAPALFDLARKRLPQRVADEAPRFANWLVIAVVAVLLSRTWEPLGVGAGLLPNVAFVAVVIGGTLLLLSLFQRSYSAMLGRCLERKAVALAGPVLLIAFGATAWLGFDATAGWLPSFVRESRPVEKLAAAFPGFGKEFMPPLDEGSYLFMPTTMPHASIGEATDVLHTLDLAIAAIPEVESAVGKLGRVDSSLDPAPISMVETVVNYKTEYLTDDHGRRIRVRFDKKAGAFARDARGELIPDRKGRYYRQWRDHIHDPDDIWREIVEATRMPGTTSAPKLQPIAARLVMLQSGMRAPMGVKIKGPDLETIERVGLEIERFLKEVPSVEPAAVFADRIVGKPYLEIAIDRERIARYGISIREVQDVIEVAVGGKRLTTTVEGRERYPVRVRYMRELRDRIESLEKIFVPSSGGAQIPLTELAAIEYVRGPQAIRSEDTFLVGYVLFDKKSGFAEVDVVEDAAEHLESLRASGDLVLPAGVSYTFAGSYENQVRSERRLLVVLPVALFAIFMILYFQFRSTATTLVVFSSVFVAWAGGFVLMWLYGRPGFMNFEVLGTGMRDLFSMGPVNLSVAVWVGFLALFGIASDNGVILATYLDQSFADRRPATVAEVRDATIHAAVRRLRPCLMTTATTILALLPVLTSTGRGSDVMVPMAIPTFGGMLVVVVTLFTVPVLYSLVAETRLRFFPVSESSGERDERA